jgi:hypothetical protein
MTRGPGSSKSSAIYSFALQRARETGEDRTLWLVPEQTKVIFRERDGERTIVVWNRHQAWNAALMVRFRQACKIPAHAYVDDKIKTVREDQSYEDWYGVRYRWVPETEAGSVDGQRNHVSSGTV